MHSRRIRLFHVLLLQPRCCSRARRSIIPLACRLLHSFPALLQSGHSTFTPHLAHCAVCVCCRLVYCRRHSLIWHYFALQAFAFAAVCLSPAIIVCYCIRRDLSAIQPAIYCLHSTQAPLGALPLLIRNSPGYSLAPGFHFASFAPGRFAHICCFIYSPPLRQAIALLPPPHYPGRAAITAAPGSPFRAPGIRYFPLSAPVPPPLSPHSHHSALRSIIRHSLPGARSAFRPSAQFPHSIPPPGVPTHSIPFPLAATCRPHSAH